METTAIFSCNIGTTDASAALGMEIWLDQDQIYNNEHITETVEFAHTLSDSDGEHELRFVMKNKTMDHTKVDEDGKIIKDAWLILNNVKLKDVELGQVFVDQAVYTHDFNGTQPKSANKFYGEMGCNGTVSLTFTTPIYLWLLEHM